MSVSDQINILKTNLSGAYDVIENKGGVIPDHKNTDNLDNAINTISGSASSKREENVLLKYYNEALIKLNTPGQIVLATEPYSQAPDETIEDYRTQLEEI